MKKKNKLPEYVIEELIPRFRGIDNPTIANVKCEILNMNGNFIVSKTSMPDYDKLHLNIDDSLSSEYEITLCSDQVFNEKKESYDRYRIGEYDKIDGMLTTYHHTATTGSTYVTPDGFEKHFKFRTLFEDFGIDIKKKYKFNESKFKLNDVFKISFTRQFDEKICYGILIKIEDTKLSFKVPKNPYVDDNTPYTYECSIDWIVDGTVEIERIDL